MIILALFENSLLVLDSVTKFSKAVEKEFFNSVCNSLSEQAGLLFLMLCQVHRCFQ